MSGKTLSLIGGALVAAALAFFVAQNRAPSTQVVAQAQLFVGLSEGINDVDRVTVTGAGNEVKVTLVRGEAAWTVAQRGGYRADPAKVRKLLIDLADAQLIERKTARPENYAVLGVEDVSAQTATGVQIALGGLGAEQAVILGNSARNNAAMYVRRSAEAVSWVANARLRFDQTPAAWLVKDLIDINTSRMQRMRIEHADGEVVDVARAGVNFEVLNAPDGKTLADSTTANETAGVINNLKFEDVVAAGQFDAGDAPSTKIEFRTSDGLVVDATATAANGKYYLSLTTRPEQLTPADFASAEAPAAGEPTPAEKVIAMFSAMQAQSADINQRVDGWVFSIPLFKYEQLTRRMDAMLGQQQETMGPE
ncbi:MAG: DUF4340 domain-containing protein [Gammaproteobacteria bacterium]